MEKEYIITVRCENQPGLTNRLTAILSKHKVNIYSLTAAATEEKDIYSFVIVVRTVKSIAENITKQINKQIDVFEAVLNEEEKVLYQEVALYKISILNFNTTILNLINQSNGKILTIENDYIIIEKTGTLKETEDLYENLKPYGVIEFARSGRVVISVNSER